MGKKLRVIQMRETLQVDWKWQFYAIETKIREIVKVKNTTSSNSSCIMLWGLKRMYGNTFFSQIDSILFVINEIALVQLGLYFGYWIN